MQNRAARTIAGPWPAGHALTGTDASPGGLLPTSDPVSTGSIPPSALASAPVGGTIDASSPDAAAGESVAPSRSSDDAVVNASPPHADHEAADASPHATRR